APLSLPSTPDLCLQDSRWSRRHRDVDVRIAHSSTVTNRSPLSIAVSLEGKTFRAAQRHFGAHAGHGVMPARWRDPDIRTSRERPGDSGLVRLTTCETLRRRYAAPDSGVQR